MYGNLIHKPRFLWKVLHDFSLRLSFVGQKQYSTSMARSVAYGPEQDIRLMFDTAVKSVLPKAMVQRALKFEGSTLTVADQKYHIDKNVTILAFGKAVAGMVRAAEDILGDHVNGGVANIPYGIQEEFQKAQKWDFLPTSDSKVQLYEGAKNNLPDSDAHIGAMEIYKRAQVLGPKDIALILISGGGSALLPTPVPPVSLDDLQLVVRMMASKGSDIKDMNTVRKNLEILKGGGLAEAAAPAKVISLILSDVIGDPLDFIASGPTYPDHSTPSQCLEIFSKLDILHQIPETVTKVLHERQLSRKSNTDTKGTFSDVQNVIVGSNTIACKAIKDKAEELGYLPYLLSTELDGSAVECSHLFSNISSLLSANLKAESKLKEFEQELSSHGISPSVLKELCQVAEKSAKCHQPICVIGAGETVVNVKGHGVGGRNQEMALSFAMSVQKNMSPSGHNCKIVFLSAGTDGQDGPCRAAGAFVGQDTVAQALAQDINPQEYLDNNDSFHFFQRLNNGEQHIVTGLTGTNVMDIQLLIVQPKFVEVSSASNL